MVGAALVDDLDAPTLLLAARRTEPPALAGGWELPGGKVEPAEDPAAALHREIGEELGISISLGRLLHGPAGGDWPISERWRLRVWLAQVAEGAPQALADHDELRWVGAAAAPALPWLPADLPIIAAVGLR